MTDQDKVQEIARAMVVAGLDKMKELQGVGEHEYREAIALTVRQWLRIEGPFNIQKLSDMLVPYYSYKFRPHISQADFAWLQAEATKRVREHAMDKRTIEHLSEILEGKAPFGYDIVENPRA